MTRRRLATLALTVYAAALAVTAIPPAFRPAALRAPIASVQSVLRAFGIVPGLAVFETGYEDRVLVRQDCIRVVARDVSGAVRVLAPPEDRCVTHGVRAVVPWTEGGMRAWCCERRRASPSQHSATGCVADRSGDPRSGRQPRGIVGPCHDGRQRPQKSARASRVRIEGRTGSAA